MQQRVDETPANHYERFVTSIDVISPVDGSLYCSVEVTTADQIDSVLERSTTAQVEWSATSLAERAAICARFADLLDGNADRLGREISWQMGRPIRYAPREVTTAADRARKMIELAAPALADIPVDSPPTHELFIEKVPLGTVLVVPAWNYPYLIAINSVVPALLAGNSVVLKHSSQTPRCGQRIAELYREAGLPDGVLQSIHCDHTTTERAVADPRVAFVAFTGSVRGGHAMVRATAERFISCGLELGGKDPAYVRADADLEDAVENLVDGSFFNSGQSCCGIERIYVHRSLADRFIERFVARTEEYIVGNPLDAETTLGPLARASHAEFVAREIAGAVAAGARAHIDPRRFEVPAQGPYVAPQVLSAVDHGMNIMREETFGPVVGIMAVESDDEAIRLMNDSLYGLTASVWTRDRDAALAIGGRVATGTWFMNRCDYLDPGLAWVGVKDSGRGCSLSVLGFEQLTRPKSHHLVL